MSERFDRPLFGQAREWRELLDHNSALLRAIAERQPRPSDGAELFACYRDAAAIASLFPDTAGARNSAVVAGAAAAHAAAVAQARQDGWVEVTLEGAARRFPAGSRALTPGLWPDAWGLALVARDRSACAALCSDAAVDSSGIFDGADAFWRLVFAALAALVTSPSTYPDLAAHARHAIAATTDPVVEPGYTARLVEPLLALGDRLLEADPIAWNRALADALAGHRDWYADPERRGETPGLLAFPVLGMAALAHDRGLRSEVESGYLPGDLVSGDFPHSPPDVRYIYPLHGLRRSEEANWFLDLEGFPRSTRSHAVVRDAGRLVARYTVAGAPSIPLASADFELPPETPQRQTPPAQDALDLGELVLAAELLARREWLDEAAEAAEDARDRILPGVDAAPKSLFWTARGRDAWRKEPGRFTRERLDAFANSLRHSAQAEARARSYEFIAVIRAQVEPILNTIARDRSKQAAALLRPRPGDYGKVFVGEAIECARAAYEALWHQPSLDMAFPTASQSQLLCHVAPAGMLSEANELSRSFPEGYRHIVRWLNPHCVWVAWKYVAAGQTTGLAYDGLVWCGDHWSWFPKPYRALRSLAEKPE